MTTWQGAPRLDGVRVLVVEDVPVVKALVVDVLEESGAAVTAVDSAVEGLERLQRERPDALLTSISMPDKDGYWLIRQVRSLPLERGRATPAAAFTGGSTAEDRRDALDAGFELHVPKPIDLPSLVALVARLASASGRAARARPP